MVPGFDRVFGLSDESGLTRRKEIPSPLSSFQSVENTTGTGVL